MFSRILLRLSCVLLLLGVGGAWAATPKADFPCPKAPIRVGVSEFGAYFDGASGIDADVLRVLQDRSGCAIQVRPMTWARAQRELSAGRLEMTTAALSNEERLKNFWMIPYTQSKHQVWMLASLVGAPNSLQEFMARQELRWGVVRGYSHAAYDEAIEAAREQGRVVEVQDDRELFRLLAGGVVQAIVGHAVVLNPYRNEHPRNLDVRTVDWSPQTLPVISHLMVRRAAFSEREIKAWRSLVSGMVADGTLDQILQRHVGPVEAARMRLSP